MVLKNSYNCCTFKINSVAQWTNKFAFFIWQAEEAETAAVLNEYLEDFQTGAVGGKAFVKAGIVNPGKGEGENFSLNIILILFIVNP